MQAFKDDLVKLIYNKALDGEDISLAHKKVNASRKKYFFISQVEVLYRPN